MKVRDLTYQDCMDVLDKEVVIGSNENKRFTYNPWHQNFTIWRNGDQYMTAEDPSPLLKHYNKL